MREDRGVENSDSDQPRFLLVGPRCAPRAPRSSAARRERRERLAQQGGLALAVHGSRARALGIAASRRRRQRRLGLNGGGAIRGTHRAQRAAQQSLQALTRLRLRLRLHAVGQRRRGGERERVLCGPVARAPIEGSGLLRVEPLEQLRKGGVRRAQQLRRGEQRGREATLG